MDQKTNLKKGIFFAFFTAIISGVAIFYSKISLTKLPPLILTTGRNSYVGLLFVIYFLILGRFNEIKKLNKKEWFYLFLIGLIGGSLPFFLFFTGLKLTSPMVGNLIHKSLFIWVTIFAYFFLKERFSLSYVISFFLIFIANFIIAGVQLSVGTGEILILLATLLWSIENILAKKILTRVSSEMVGLFRMVIGGVTLLLITILSGKINLLSTINNQQLTVIITGGSILFFYVFFWYKALKYAPASLVTLILSFSVVVGNILNGSFSGIKILPKDVYSSVLITLSVVLILISSYISNIKNQISKIHIKN